MKHFKAWLLALAYALAIMAGASYAQQGTGPIPTGAGTYGPPMSSVNGHITFGNGAAPTLNAGCGTGASVVSGTDSVFAFTSGTSAGATCAITFALPWLRPPTCIVASAGGAVPVYATGAQNIVMTAASSTVYAVHCFGQPGG